MHKVLFLQYFYEVWLGCELGSACVEEERSKLNPSHASYKVNESSNASASYGFFTAGVSCSIQNKAISTNLELTCNPIYLLCALPHVRSFHTCRNRKLRFFSDRISEKKPQLKQLFFYFFFANRVKVCLHLQANLQDENMFWWRQKLLRKHRKVYKRWLPVACLIGLPKIAYRNVATRGPWTTDANFRLWKRFKVFQEGNFRRHVNLN